MTTIFLIIGAVLLLFALAGCLIVWTFGWGDARHDLPQERRTHDTPKPRRSDGA